MNRYQKLVIDIRACRNLAARQEPAAEILENLCEPLEQIKRLALELNHERLGEEVQLIIWDCRLPVDPIETAEQRLAKMPDRLKTAEHMALTLLRTDGVRHES
tara:strand:- start:6674 stop:6982 length:309 start_codon:yes stop_codon:yes gene_type:complete